MLADVKINELSQHITDTYIKTTTYPTLLHNLLEKSPVSAVINDINSQLALIAKNDKSDTETALVKKAYAAQMEQDLEENQNDTQEMRADLLLSSQLTLEAAGLAREITTNELRIQISYANINHLLDQIRELNQQIAHYEAAHEHAHGQTTHEHPHEQTTHEHTHGHDNAKSSLETQRLIALRKRFQTELSLVQKNLSELQLDDKKTRDHAQEIEKKVTQELPQKAQQRNERAMERTAREHARLSNAPRKQQLTLHNYNLLVQAIAGAHRHIDKQERQLKDTAANQSYKLFIERIETHLKSESTLSYQETEALKQVIIHMHAHLDALEKRAVEMKKLEDAKNNKNRLFSKLQKDEQRLHQLKNNNPVLESQNQQLLEQNQQLEQTIAHRQTLNKKLLKISAYTFLSTGALLGGAFLAMKLLPIAASLIPLLLIPAGITTAATLGLLIASFVYTRLSNSGKSQQKQNLATITNNSEQIATEDNEIKWLEQVSLPLLKTQLSDVEQQVTGLEQSISELEQNAELFLNKARTVVPAIIKDPGSIFTPPTPDSTTKPSILPIEDDVDVAAVSYRP